MFTTDVFNSPASTRFKTAMMLFAEFGLPRLLEPEFEVVGALADGNALHGFGQLHPDVCVIDISMPYLNGIEAVIKLRECELTRE